MKIRQEYLTRRQKLAASLPPDTLAIIPSAAESLRTGDTHYRFRQDSNFYYLTGFNEPEAVLLIIAGKPGQSYLFNRPHNPNEEQWTGRRLGQQVASFALGVDAAFSIESFASRLPDLISGKQAIYYSMGRHPHIEKIIFTALGEVKKQVRRGVKAPQSLCDLEPLLSEMRLIKSEVELKLMRRAAEISVAGHKAVMQTCKQATNEQQLEAELLYAFIHGGCRALAYESIVASGANSCTLHYTENNQPLCKGDLLLVDAGGEFENYAADITRTFPINGRFSKEQRAIYALVLKAQKAGIACIQPGLAWNQIQQTILQILTEGLCELGILKGSVEDLIAKEAYKPFYMHNSGHWLGLDVHDVGAYKINNDWRPLQPGMVLTVEPGLYFTASMEGVDDCWSKIGVRIEDDIVVTEKGHENLTANLPVEIEEIEALVGGG